jgi:hypothetical protein
MDSLETAVAVYLVLGPIVAVLLFLAALVRLLRPTASPARSTTTTTRVALGRRVPPPS